MVHSNEADKKKKGEKDEYQTVGMSTGSEYDDDRVDCDDDMMMMNPVYNLCFHLRKVRSIFIYLYHLFFILSIHVKQEICHFCVVVK